MSEIVIPLAALRAVEPAITIPERGEGRAAPGPAPRAARARPARPMKP